MMDFGHPILPARFWAKARQDESGCWLWTASTVDGYGQIKSERRMVKAHRLTYEAANGPIPQGLDVDHLCRVRHCVNPEHLEAVTHVENIRRGDSLTTRRSAQEACKRGHPFDEANTYLWRTSRICRTCRSEQNRARYLAKKGAA